jgi:uncharacterized protein YigA (DUF484 family)
MTGENASNPSRKTEEGALDPTAVETFFRENPAFFKHRPDLLMALDLPHGGPGAVSLVERQVNLLRERNIEMRGRIAHIADSAQNNDVLYKATRDTVLDLLSCRDANHVASQFTSSLHRHFQVELAALLWFDNASALPTLTNDDNILSADRTALVQHLIKGGSPLCAVLRQEEMTALFGAAAADGSAALAPLVIDGNMVGLIAVGSSDPHRYEPTVDTLFLEHLADVVVRLQCLVP